MRFAPDLVGALKALADRWCEVTGLELTTLAHRAVSSSGLFHRIDKGQTLTVATWQQVVDYLADPAHWPEGDAPDLALSIDGVRYVHDADDASVVTQPSSFKSGANISRSESRRGLIGGFVERIRKAGGR